MGNFTFSRLNKYDQLSGPILESKSMDAIFQKKEKKGQKKKKKIKIGKIVENLGFGQKCTKFEHVLKKP